MADTVRYLMEEMIPELEDMEVRLLNVVHTTAGNEQACVAVLGCSNFQSEATPLCSETLQPCLPLVSPPRQQVHNCTDAISHSAMLRCHLPLSRLGPLPRVLRVGSFLPQPQ